MKTESVKYFRILIDKKITWEQQINHVSLKLNKVNAMLSLKLNKVNAMLSNLRYVLDIKTVRSVYYAIFELHLWYASLVWAQNASSVKRFHLLQRKSLRIMFFQCKNFFTLPLFKMSKILKSFHKTAHENCFFSANL